jgi:hypothetical protein
MAHTVSAVKVLSHGGIPITSAPEEIILVLKNSSVS